MKIKHYIFVIMCIFLYSIPIFCIVSISEKEKKLYEEDVHFEFEKSSYGEPVKLDKRNINEYYLVDGVITCRNAYSLNVNADATLKCEVGDEIHSGDVLATYGHSDTLAEFNGIIENIDFGDSLTITYYDFSDLVLEIYLEQDKFGIVENKKFQDENGEKLELIEKSNIIEDGKFKLILSVPKGMDAMYGMQVSNYKLYTGIRYSGVLVAEKNCVYKKDDQYYVRVVDEKGKFISEEPVKIGFTTGDFICVSSDNIDESTYCDSGYAVVSDEDTSDEVDGDSSEDY